MRPHPHTERPLPGSARHPFVSQDFIIIDTENQILANRRSSKSSKPENHRGPVPDISRPTHGSLWFRTGIFVSASLGAPNGGRGLVGYFILEPGQLRGSREVGNRSGPTIFRPMDFWWQSGYDTLNFPSEMGARPRMGSKSGVGIPRFC